jgi:hypothetical protein
MGDSVKRVTRSLGVSKMAKPEAVFQFGYEDIFKLCKFGSKSFKAGMNRIYAEKSRGFDPHNLKSLVLFLARHGSKDLKEEIIRSAFEIETNHKTESKVQKTGSQA